MKISLTKFLKLFCLLGAGLLVSVVAQAQTEFTINSPSSLAGSYTEFTESVFGPALYGEITGNLVASDDGAGVLNGCDAFSNATDVAGNIALIDRGTCAFTQKVLNAQSAGAVAAIVCMVNNDPLIRMAGCDDIDIPSFMITKQLCDQIRMELPVNVSFKNPFEPPTTDVVVWGSNPGEGDFDGGLNGWTTNGITDAAHVWKWAEKGGITADPPVDAPATVLPQCDAIASPTAANGAVAFHAIGYQLQVNPELVQPYSSFSGELISPSIDLSNVTDAQVRIIQSYAGLNGDGALFSFSTDGGTTYSEPVAVNDDFEANEFTTNPHVRRIDLPGAAGSSDVQLKFTFSGDFYFWMMDDIVIIERPPNSLAIPAFGEVVAENYATPLGLVEPIYFGGYASNTGSNAQTNVKLEVTGDHYDESGTLATEDVYTGSVTLETLDVGQDSIVVFPDDATFTPTEKGTYVMEYVLTQDEDELDPDDNFATSTFQITSNILSKAPIDANGLPIATNALTGPDGPGPFEYGSHFYIANGEDFTADSITFGYSSNGSITGEDVVLLLSKWVDANQDGLIDGGEDDGELERIGYNSYSYTSDDEDGVYITLPFLDFETFEEKSIPLEDNTHYILSGRYEGSNTIFLLANLNIDYGPMVDASIERVNATSDVNLIRWADVLESGGEWSSGGYGDANIPAMSMHVTSTVISNEEVYIPDSTIEIYPNPVEDILTVSLEAEDTSGDWNISISDVTGRVVSPKRTLQQATFPLQLDVKNIPAGTYLLTFENNQQTLTKRFIKH